MLIEERVHAFHTLGKYLEEDIFSNKSEDLRLIEIKNPWFTFENIKFSLNAWQKHLKRDILEAWLKPDLCAIIKSLPPASPTILG